MKTLLLFFLVSVSVSAEVKTPEQLFNKIGIEEQFKLLNELKKGVTKDGAISFEIDKKFKHKEYWDDLNHKVYKKQLIEKFKQDFSEEQRVAILNDLEKLFLPRLINDITFQRPIFDLIHHIHMETTYTPLKKDTHIELFAKILNLKKQNEKLKEMIVDAKKRIEFLFVYYDKGRKDHRLDIITLETNLENYEQIGLSYFNLGLKSFKRSTYVEFLRMSQKNPALAKFLRTIFSHHFNSLVSIFEAKQKASFLKIK